MDWFGKSTSKIIVVGVAAAAIVAAILFAPYYRIIASPLTGSRSTGLSGSFRVIRAIVYRPGYPDQSAFTTGIRSERFGGACVTFAAADLGYTAMAAKQCSTNTDCSHEKGKNEPDDPAVAPNEQTGVYRPDPVNAPDHFESRIGYCDRSAHSCYAKPIYFGGSGAATDSSGVDGALCTKRIKQLNQSPWDEGVDNSLKVEAATLQKVGLVDGQIHARIVACLQGTGPIEEGCKSIAGKDRIEVLGDPVTVNP